MLDERVQHSVHARRLELQSANASADALPADSNVEVHRDGFMWLQVGVVIARLVDVAPELDHFRIVGGPRSIMEGRSPVFGQGLRFRTVVGSNRAILPLEGRKRLSAWKTFHARTGLTAAKPAATCAPGRAVR